MFTGIIEELARVLAIQPYRGNVDIKLSVSFLDEVKVDQSIAHNGVCLTVTRIDDQGYWVTAIAETLRKTQLESLVAGDEINVERCMPAFGRFDGHIVQGHVDCTALCTSVIEDQGSWLFDFTFDTQTSFFTVGKGSIAVNGVSLTVADNSDSGFRVAIIPYTYQHTNFKNLKPGDRVNIEFDILGKYVAEALRRRGIE